MTKPQASRMPDFKSIAEEATFWDTHDTTDFEAEFEEVEVQFEMTTTNLGKQRIRSFLKFVVVST